MNSHEEALTQLALRLDCPDDLPSERRLAALERVVLPMIRCALRSGRGAAPLVNWVRQNRSSLSAQPGTPEALPLDGAASRLCHKLCTLLLEQMESHVRRSGKARETVVGC